MAAWHRIFVIQAMTALMLAVGFAMLSKGQSVAALIAGAVCVLPDTYYGWRASRERESGRLLVLGIVKSVTKLALMVLAFATLAPAPLGFFAALIAMQVMYVVGSVNASGAGASVAQTPARSSEHDRKGLYPGVQHDN